MARTADEITRLSQERFRRMRPFGRGDRLPEVDTTALPPGPRWHPLVQSVALLRFRHRFVPWARRRYGDAFTLLLPPQRRPLVVFNRPEDVKQIFAGDPAYFHAGKGNAILGPIMGEHSLLLVDGEEHKRARKLLMPAFSGQALRGYEDLVTGLAKTEVGSWVEGEPFRALDRMNALTLEVILHVVFGVTDERRLAELRPLVNATVDVSPAVLLGWGVPRLQRIGIWKRTVETSYALDRLLYAEIADRRAAPDLADRTDVLSQLIRVDDGGDRLTDPELRDQLVTLLLAGHETTATALAWALYEIGRDPAQLARAQEAARHGDDDHLEAVVKESMRVHPVIPMVVRTLLRPATIGDVDVPAGATVAASILLAHGRADSHPDPQVFRPERFLGHNPAPNTWIPFGGGVRRCIGAGFSVMEGVAVLREILTAYDVRAAGTDTPKVRNITSVPRRGARIVVTSAAR